MSDQFVTQPTVYVEVSKERGKPRLLALLFCDFTNITKDDKPNLLGVFDRILVDPEKPTTPFFTIFIRLAEVTDAFELTIFGPDDLPVTQLRNEPAEAKYSDGLPRQVQVALGMQFEVKKEGPFWFDVSYHGVSLGGAGLVMQYRKKEDKQSGTDTYI